MEVTVAAVELVLEDVGHGDEVRRPVRHGQGVVGRTGAAAAAADEGDLDRVVFGGVDGGNRHAGQRRGRRDAAGRLHHVTAHAGHYCLWGCSQWISFGLTTIQGNR